MNHNCLIQWVPLWEVKMQHSDWLELSSIISFYGLLVMEKYWNDSEYWELYVCWKNFCWIRVCGWLWRWKTWIFLAFSCEVWCWKAWTWHNRKTQVQRSLGPWAAATEGWTIRKKFNKKKYKKIIFLLNYMPQHNSTIKFVGLIFQRRPQTW